MSGPVGSSQWMYASGSGFFSYSIDQSLRFNDDDSAKLYFDPTSDGNKQVWTFSAWVKRGNLGLNYATIFLVQMFMGIKQMFVLTAQIS